VRETEEVKRFGLPEAPRSSPWGDVSPELDESGLLGTVAGAVKRFMEHAYMLRNAKVHGDDPTSETLTVLNGTATDKLDAVVDDLERVMRRAAYRLLHSDELGQLA
jgi:hypothetical protein